MTDLILQYLNTLVSTVGNIERTYCIVERRSGSDGTTLPYEYVGGGNFKPVEVDGGSVSYFRLRAARTLETVDGRTADKPIQATYPLRFVAMIRRDDNNPEVYSQDVANILTGTNQDLRTILGANRAIITVTSIETDTPKIWQEEFTTPITEPKYSRSMVMIDLTVTVVATRSCWADCADYPDILQMFPWCNPATLDRLTSEQLACIEGELCVPLCEQLADVLPVDVVADVFDCLTQAAQTELLDSECVIPPCADATIEINGTAFDTVASGGTLDIPVINGGSNAVGSLQGSDWVIGNNATFINSVQVTDQEAEIYANISVELDGNPSGSWNAGTQTWEVTSSPCADATVHNSDNSYSTTVASGDDLSIPNTTINVNGSLLVNQPSTVTKNVVVKYVNGTPVGSIVGGEVEVPNPVAAGTLAIGLSTSTPNYKDAVTITATPTGFTPTSYTFIVPKDDGSYMRVTQASNVYVWTAVYTGAQTIEVTATDGVLLASKTTTVTVTWAWGKAIQLNGTTQHVETISTVGGDIPVGNKHCISMWIKPTSYSNTPIIFSKGAFWLWMLSSTNLRLSNGRNYTVSMATGSWYHVLVNCTNNGGTNWEVYINGSLNATGSGSTSVATLTQEIIYLGRYQSAGFNLNGCIDETLVYRGYNPSAAQVAAYYNSGSGAHPIALGKMPDFRINYDDNVLDQSGNGYNCQLINSPSYVAH